MTNAPEIPLVDETAMTRFHRIFREALEAAPRYVGDATAPERVELVGAYYANVLKLLHAHHEAEDLVIFPLLLERLPDDVDVISVVNTEHDTVLGSLHAAEEALEAWRAGPTDANRQATVDALATLGAALLHHLDHEEADVVPMIGRVINVAEWGQMSGTAFQIFAGDKRWLVIGLIQEQMFPHEIVGMEANMPPPVTEAWVSSGRAMFTEFVAELRG